MPKINAHQVRSGHTIVWKERGREIHDRCHGNRDGGNGQVILRTDRHGSLTVPANKTIEVLR